MSDKTRFDEIDDEFKKLIEKADKITTIENLEQDKIDRVNEAREQAGRLNIAIEQTKERIKTISRNMKEAQELLDQYDEYFEIINNYSGIEMVEQLESRINNYDRNKYFRIQDRVSELTERKSFEQLEQERSKNEEELAKLLLRKEKNLDEILDFINEIKDEIEKLSK